MPRAKAFDPDVALDRAVELFWQCGYDGASMAKLLAFMGISRQSLYDTFGDKHTLFLRALDRYRDNLRGELGGLMAAQGSGVAGIRAVFGWVTREVLENPEHRSCLIANAALELGRDDPEVRARVADHLREVEEMFFGALEADRDPSPTDDDVDNRTRARCLTNAIHGLGIMARGGVPPAVLHDTIDATLSVHC